MDCFQAHLINKLKTETRIATAIQASISGGCTVILQPLHSVLTSLLRTYVQCGLITREMKERRYDMANLTNWATFRATG